MPLCPTCNANNDNSAKSCFSCGSPLAGGLDSTSQFFPSQELACGTHLRGGEYQIRKKLGRGGFGITYRCSEASLNRDVAIKEYFPDCCLRQGTNVYPDPDKLSQANYQSGRDKFLEEARILAQFQHPNIVRVFTSFEENNTAYMVMEYLSGGSVMEQISASGAIPVHKVLDYAEQICKALHEIHSKNVLHRDLKPDNIMLTAVGRPVLVDFGNARQFVAGKTINMTRLVTEGYAAPEQYERRSTFGPYTDIYSLGVTLYQCLTGRTDFPDARDRLRGVEVQPVTEVNSSVSPQVSEAIAWAMELEPADRPQTVEEFLSALLGGSIRRRPPKPVSKAVGGPVPLKFQRGQANSLSDLVELTDSYWDEAEDYLFNGTFALWLSQMGEAALAQQARTIAATFKGEQRKGLELFVREACKAAGLDSLPMLAAKPAHLHLGSLPVGARRRVPVRLLNQGRGYVWGTVAVQPALPGVFSPFRFEGAPTQIDLQIDLTETPPGKYRSELIITPVGVPNALKVPITMEVVPTTLRVEPAAVDMGELEFGARRTQTVRVNTEPAGGRAIGTVKVWPPSSGVACEPAVIDASSLDLRVTVNANDLESGRQYSTRIILDTNLGRVSIPFRFSVGFDRQLVWRHTAAYALGGTALLAILRAFLAETGPVFHTWFLSYTNTDVAEGTWIGGLVGAVTVGALIQLVRTVRQKTESV
jgi:serine/threonine protein kinase